GTFRGGAIAPGLSITHDVLVNRAVCLHKVDILPPPDPIGRNTGHAMQSGIFWGYVSLVSEMILRMKRSLNEPNIKVIATGGAAPLVSQHIPDIDVTNPTLTLDGLRLIAALNHQI